MTVRKASAKYEGLGKSGKGHVSLGSGVLNDQPYGFNTRFENEPGTNPEELIAAAHASCFTMALSFALAGAGHNDGTLDTDAAVTLEKDGDGWKVKLAVRDLPPKEYDADGNRVYGKFEMEEMSDDGEDSGEDERVKIMAFAELNDARLLERAAVEVATAAGDEAGEQRVKWSSG